MKKCNLLNSCRGLFSLLFLCVVFVGTNVNVTFAQIQSSKYKTTSVEKSDVSRGTSLQKTLGLPNLKPLSFYAIASMDTSIYRPVVVKRTLLPAGASFSGSSGLDNAQDDSPFYDTDSLYIAYTVTNNGAENCLVSFPVDLYLDGIKISSLTIPGLNVNAGYTYYNIATGKLSAGVHTLFVRVDPNNIVAESDENDNTYWRQFTVLSRTPKYTLSGTVTGATNVTFTLSGGKDSVAMGNNYSFTVDSGKTYTITPSKTGYTFTPISKTWSTLSTNGTQNFVASINTYKITTTAGVGGTITPANPNVNYGDNCTITIAPSTYYKIASITVDGANFPVTNSAGQSYTFTGVTATHTISATFARLQVILSGSVIGATGVTFTLSGGKDSTTTGITYNFTVDAGLNYSVTPSKSGYSFNPPSKTFSNVTANQTQNFTATQLFTISGDVTGATDVMFIISGDTVITFQGTSYSFPLAAGKSITIMPAKSGYTFTPILVNYSVISENKTQRFVATKILNYYSLSGNINDQISVTFTLSGSKDSVINGNSYNFLVLEGGTYTVTPSKSGYIFTPPSKSWTNVASNGTQNFDAMLNTISRPTLLTPLDSARNQQKSLELSWSPITGTKYEIQVAKEKEFINVIFEDTNVSVTKSIVSLNAHTTYYWKVRAKTSIAISDWSGIRRFTTLNNKPNLPLLVNPTDNSEIQLTYPRKAINFEWQASSDIDNDTIRYSLFINTGSNETKFTGLTDRKLSNTIESFIVPNKTYTWKVFATDGYDTVQSSVFTFKTSATVTGIESNSLNPGIFQLRQNYPNPFNPSTTINYQLSTNSFVTLKIYDVLGKEIDVLINEILDAGNHSVQFKASDLQSGVYIYELRAGDITMRKKMLFLK